MTKDEALKMAIEGLLELHSFVNEELETAYRCNTNQAVKLNAKLDGVEKSIKACKEALEQPAWNEEKFNAIAYAYRSCPAHEVKMVSERYQELVDYVLSLKEKNNAM